MEFQSPKSPNSTSNPQRVGQACDRCRRKKIKCDGAFPSCRACEKTGLICEVSTTLRRQTKVRGFTSDEQRLEQLQAELTKCQQKLQVEKDRSLALQRDLSRQEQLTLSIEAGANPRLVEPVVAVPTERRPVDDPTYVIKHMGRLVHDETGVGRFAGSTTGVHFVLTVEQECQKALNLSSGFPESCFRLFLAESSPSLEDVFEIRSVSIRDRIRQSLAYPSEHYCHQADSFIQKWEAFCPVLVRKQLMTDIRDLMSTLYSLGGAGAIDYSTTLILLMILNIRESFTSSPAQDSEPSPECLERLSLASLLIDKVVNRGNLKSLQALSLYALFNQLRGQCLTLTTLNGTMVRLAQSLGLHRHARRFKMGVGEIELRKRLWWWVYVFDRFTSLLHGIPPLINDVDVDNDLPIDCHLHDLGATELSHPLPGERTAVFVFLQYVNLGKMLSKVLGLLYTTTQRRDGARKITELDRDLRVWNQNLKANGILFDIGNAGLQHSDTANDPYNNTTIWLQLMSNIALNFIHRPGLSFDDTTPEFSTCLSACVDSGSAILSLVEKSQIPRWLRNLSLIGPATVFQSSLIHIYAQLKCRILKPDGLPALDTSMDMILKGISILTSDLQNSPPTREGNGFYRESLNGIIETLQTLLSSLPMVAHGLLNTAPVVEDGLPSAPDRFDEQAWGGNALDALNYMTDSDWMGDASGPFMGFMDLSGS